LKKYTTEAKDAAEKATSIHVVWGKAWFRSAVIAEQLEELQMAFCFFVKAHYLELEEAAFRTSLHSLQSRIKVRTNNALSTCPAHLEETNCIAGNVSSESMVATCSFGWLFKLSTQTHQLQWIIKGLSQWIQGMTVVTSGCAMIVEPLFSQLQQLEPGSPQWHNKLISAFGHVPK
jgi:hypothetical protein